MAATLQGLTDSPFKQVSIDTYRFFTTNRKLSLALVILGAVATVFASIGMAGVGASFVATIGSSTPFYVLIAGIATTTIGLLLLVISIKRDDSIKFDIVPEEQTIPAGDCRGVTGEDKQIFLRIKDPNKQEPSNLFGHIGIAPLKIVVKKVGDKNVNFVNVNIVSVEFLRGSMKNDEPAYKILEKSLQYIIKTIGKNGKNTLITVRLQDMAHHKVINSRDAAAVFLKMGFVAENESDEVTNLIEDINKAGSKYPKHTETGFSSKLVLYYYPDATKKLGTKFLKEDSPGKFSQASVRKVFSKKGITLEKYLNKT